VLWPASASVKVMSRPATILQALAGALEHKHGLDRLAAAQAKAFVHDGLQGQLLAATHLEIGSDHRHSAPASMIRSCSALAEKAAKHHTVGGANAGTGLHGDHAFKRHGHVNQHAVALIDATGLERIGKLADLGQQFLV
jgi:hypothetical protein